MSNPSPKSTGDLRPSELRFVAALQQLGYGHFELLRIEHSQLVLDPWPMTVRDVKFCTPGNQREAPAEDFVLKQQVVEFFEYVRSVEVGEIRTLVVRGGLPFSMQVEQRPGEDGVERG
ncbi:MAG TPA: hypothetical protein VME43_30360 [Bryobacteraceae bacterium]|nr:hypothetical protein [Bryobacteraceae bacterium]